MSILLFLNDKCFYFPILVYQGRIPLDYYYRIFLIKNIVQIFEISGKPRRENYGYSIVQIYPGLAVFFGRITEAGISAPAKSMTMGSPAGPDILLLLRIPRIDSPGQGLASGQ